MSWIACFDASALLKRYTEEAGSDLVDELFERLAPESICCSVIGVAEVVSILVRKLNDRRIDSGYFHQAMLNFREDFIADTGRLLPLDSSTVLDSLDLIYRHSINATDAAILRSLLVQRETRPENLLLVTADRRLARAASDEGIRVLNPETASSLEIEAFG